MACVTVCKCVCVCVCVFVCIDSVYSVSDLIKFDWLLLTYNGPRVEEGALVYLHGSASIGIQPKSKTLWLCISTCV